MEPKEFLSRVVPDDGSYYIGTLTGEKRKRYQQQQVSSLEKLEAEVQTLINKKVDIYFSTGTYNKGSSREAKNVKSKKSLYLDLDCGDGKAFPSKKDAIVELKKFLAITKIPTPNIIVDSGNGYHTYWTLNTPITAGDWGVYAHALKCACEDTGLQADPKVTVDAARILRVPGTVNFKHPTNPKECKIIFHNEKDFTVEEIRTALLQWTKPTLSAVGTDVAVDNSDLGTVSYANTTWLAQYIFDECPTLAYIRETGGAECVEPLWMSTLHLLAFCEDGESWIHEVSSKHPGYSHQGTASKFAMRLKAREEGRGKPTLCSTFAGYAGTKCAGCPHNGNIKSPISLGKPPANHLPQGYQQSKAGMFRYNPVDEDYVYLFPYRLDDFEIIRDDDGHQLIMFQYQIGNSGTKRGELPYALLADPRSAQKHLSQFHMTFPDDKQYKEFKRLMVTWAQQMEAAKMVTVSPSAFGWVKKGDRHGFTLAEQIVWEDGSGTPVPVGSNPIVMQYKPKGKLEHWKDAATLITDSPQMELHIALATAFASPLIPFTGTSGMMLSLVSAKSGTGKSSALKTAQAVWGCPRRGVNALNDTPLSVVKRLGKLNNLPAYWDELHVREDVKQFIKLIFQLGQGKERSRLRSDTSFQDVGTWNTLITAASNESIADHMVTQIRGTDAGVMRVLEMEMVSAGFTNNLSNAMRVFSKLDTNYGEAGLLYAFYITEHRDALNTQVKSLLHKLTELDGITSSDRFRLATISALVVGAQAANACGLTSFNVPAILKHLVAAVRQAKANDAEEHTANTTWSPLSLIGEFINEFSDQTYVTEFLPRRGVGSNNLGTIITKPKRFPVIIHNAQQDRVVRLDYDYFREWMIAKRGASTRYLQKLRSMNGVSYVNTGSLTSGLEQHVPGDYRRIISITYDELIAGER